MTQFKPGDTVRRVKHDNGGGARVGQLATVVHTNRSGFVAVYYVGYRPDSTDPTVESWCNSFVELAEEYCMNKPHKHRDLIIAWANGAQIQIRYSAEGSWMDTNTPRWYAHYEYRIKPKMLKYKRFLWKSAVNPDSGVAVHIVCPEGQAREPRDTWKGFIRWIDNDWQEVEI